MPPALNKISQKFKLANQQTSLQKSFHLKATITNSVTREVHDFEVYTQRASKICTKKILDTQ